MNNAVQSDRIIYAFLLQFSLKHYQSVSPACRWCCDLCGYSNKQLGDYEAQSMHVTDHKCHLIAQLIRSAIVLADRLMLLNWLLFSRQIIFASCNIQSFINWPFSLCLSSHLPHNFSCHISFLACFIKDSINSSFFNCTAFFFLLPLISLVLHIPLDMLSWLMALEVIFL